VYVSAFHAGDYVRVTVRDEGPGIGDDNRAKLFGKFQRLTAQPIGNEKSTGLGLLIAKKFTALINGKIWCESKQGREQRLLSNCCCRPIWPKSTCFLQNKKLNKDQLLFPTIFHSRCEELNFLWTMIRCGTAEIPLEFSIFMPCFLEVVLIFQQTSC
jgi:signal transduction histidine kinase